MEPLRQMENAALGYDDTPVLPDSGYTVHDGTRPQPPIVTPGQDGGPPSDAVIRFDGASLDKWVSMKTPGASAAWKVENGYCEVTPGAGNIETREAFGSLQLHLEFASPVAVEGDGQARGNSGIFLMNRYEIQILDNYENPTYADGTVGGIYGQYGPLANAIRKPGDWNQYDIVWEAPVFEGDALVRPAFVTVLLNGVLLHHHRELQGPTMHKALTQYTAHPSRQPLSLQDHGNPVRFRNIWVRHLDQ